MTLKRGGGGGAKLRIGMLWGHLYIWDGSRGDGFGVLKLSSPCSNYHAATIFTACNCRVRPLQKNLSGEKRCLWLRTTNESSCL